MKFMKSKHKELTLKKGGKGRKPMFREVEAILIFKWKSVNYKKYKRP